MNRTLKAVAFASLCFSLMLPINSFASGGGKGGGGSTGGGGTGGSGGGKPAQPRVLLSAGFQGVLVVNGQISPVSDVAAILTVTATNHEGDAPKISVTSGPAGLIIHTLSSVDNPPNGNGFTTATYEWTPSRNEIGTTPRQITFTATTQSGQSVSLPVVFGPVQDSGPTFLSGFSAERVNDHIEAHWNPNESGDPDPLIYTLTACYKSVVPGTSDLAIDCDTVDKTDALNSLGIPLGPTTNIGNPAVPATYYGLFVDAWKASSGLHVGHASFNLQ
jgi:hypothetical protein